MLRRPSLPHTPGPQSPVSPPHNPHPRASPLKPRKSPPPPLLHRTQPRGCFYLRHMQVRRHRHPITARKIRLRRRLVTCKPRRDAIPTRHARPATMPTRHAQAPPWRHLNTERKAPPPPTRRNARDPAITPSQTWYARPRPRQTTTTMATTMERRWGRCRWGTVGWRRQGWQRRRGTLTLRLYIFYLCNKWI